MLRALVVAAVLLTACPATAPAPAPTPEPSPVPSFDPLPLEERALVLVNLERAREGLPPLRPARDLRAFARRHSDAMVAAGRIHHSRRRERAALRGLPIGENVGTGGSVTRIHDAFMDSPRHRRVILGRRFTHAGIGIVASDRHGVTALYVTQVFARRG